ncbi:hypothetical protein BDV93DRAFT_23375 [Ceratobasidium sp. AG-I]|nr:hypothetical protein BDV93DRAFT_23375 [Ceratobasidium sp. AG-I]
MSAFPIYHPRLKIPESASSKDAPAFAFQPPEGGDVSLKSSDGTIFLAHSVLLRLASKVFEDMFTGPTTADTVELAEDAEAVSLMLAFIYPVLRPSIDTLRLLEKAMVVAHKYEIDVLLKTLDQCRNENRKLIRLDPVRVFRLASVYGLRDTQTLAAKLIGPAQYDMLTPDGIVQFAKGFPGSAHIIGLVGIQGARYKILETIFADSGFMIWPYIDSFGGGFQYFATVQDPSHGTYVDCMACMSCWQVGRTAGNVRVHYQPGWLLKWAAECKAALLSAKPLDECHSLFRISYLADLRTKGPPGTVCAACVDQTFKHHARFDKWASDVRRLLETELGKLDVLYAL